MDLRQLRHVLALADLRNFHRAAESLGLTQPALSKSLQHTERELGVRLFDRHGKAVELTAFGHIVADAAREVTHTLDRLNNSIAQAADLESGLAAIGAGAYVADLWLGPVANRVLHQYPRLQVKIVIEHWSSLPDLLRLGEIDIFVASVEHVRNLPEFHVIDFPPQQGIWVCRPGHPLAARRAPLHRELVAQYLIVGPPAPTSIRYWLENAGARPDRMIQTTSACLVKAMIRGSDAISLVHPDMVCHELERGDMRALVFDAPAITFQSGIVWLATRSLGPASHVFVREFLIEVGLDPNLANPYR